MSRPACSVAESELSSDRTGFGGIFSAIAKSVKACISASDSGVWRPTKPTNAGLNSLNEASSSVSTLPRTVCRVPPMRSPRQCVGPFFAMPRSVCVVIGPFIGWNRCVVFKLLGT